MLLAREDVQSNNMHLGTTMLAGLGDVDLHQLAGLLLEETISISVLIFDICAPNFV